VPEFFPWHGSDLPVAQLAVDLLSHPERLDEQRQKLLKLVATLDYPGASLNAARLALDMIRQRAAR